MNILRLLAGALVALVLATQPALALGNAGNSYGPASATRPGIVTTGTQSFAGNKTFLGTTSVTTFIMTSGTLTLTGGTAGVGVLTATKTAETSVAELVASFGVSDNSVGKFEIRNGSSSGADFATQLFATGASSNIGLFAIAAVTTDTGSTTPAFVFDGRTAAGAVISTKDLWALRNFGTTVAKFTAKGKFVLTPAVLTSGAVSTVAITPPNDMSQTPSTEIPGFVYNTFTRSWATGALTTQREFLVKAPTYAFTGASTITDAATLVIDAAPIAGTNATITRAHALWVQAGAARFDGGILLGAAGAQVLQGTGSPEAAVAAPVGSTFHRLDGGAGTSFYVKESGAATNTGWVAK